MESFFLVKLVLQPQIDLQHAYLADNEPGWDLTTLCHAARGERRKFRVVELHAASKVGGRFHEFLVTVMQRMQDPKIWAHRFHTVFFFCFDRCRGSEEHLHCVRKKPLLIRSALIGGASSLPSAGRSSWR